MAAPASASRFCGCQLALYGADFVDIASDERCVNSNRYDCVVAKGASSRRRWKTEQLEPEPARAANKQRQVSCLLYWFWRRAVRQHIDEPASCGYRHRLSNQCTHLAIDTIYTAIYLNRLACQGLPLCQCIKFITRCDLNEAFVTSSCVM